MYYKITTAITKTAIDNSISNLAANISSFSNTPVIVWLMVRICLITTRVNKKYKNKNNNTPPFENQSRSTFQVLVKKSKKLLSCSSLLSQIGDIISEDEITIGPVFLNISLFLSKTLFGFQVSTAFSTSSKFHLKTSFCFCQCSIFSINIIL